MRILTIEQISKHYEQANKDFESFTIDSNLATYNGKTEVRCYRDKHAVPYFSPNSDDYNNRPYVLDRMGLFLIVATYLGTVNEVLKMWKSSTENKD